MTKSYRTEAPCPPPGPEPVKTYCKHCYYLCRPSYNVDKWEHWTCGTPIEGQTNPVTGEQLFCTDFCQHKNKRAKCADFLNAEDVKKKHEEDERKYKAEKLANAKTIKEKPVKAKKPWWKFWA